MNEKSTRPDGMAPETKGGIDPQIQNDPPVNDRVINQTDIKVVIIENADAKPVEDCPVMEILEAIQQGAYSKEVDKLRVYHESSPNRQDETSAVRAIQQLGAHLPGILFSLAGVEEESSGSVKHSGLLCCHLDGLGAALPAMREKIVRDRHVLAAFTSALEDGLKVIVPILPDASLHAASFQAAKDHFHQQHDYRLKDVGGDMLDICFFSADNHLHVNPQAEMIRPSTASHELPQNLPNKPSDEASSRPRAASAAADLTLFEPFFVSLLERALEAIPAHEEDTWLAIGQELFGWDEHRGAALWNSWSQTSNRRTHSQCTEKWHTFAAAQTPNTNCDLIFRQACHHGWKRERTVILELAKLEGLSRHRWTAWSAHWLQATQKALQEELARHLASLPQLVSDEPWALPVDGGMLLDEIEKTLKRFVILEPHEYAAVALWVLHTYCFDSRSYTPRLHIRSPDKRCGKSVFLNILKELCHKPILASSMSAKAMFRMIDREKPTLLLDRYEVLASEPKCEELRTVLHSGFESHGITYLVDGEQREPVGYCTFSPVIMAGIGQIPDMIYDRSISIEMRRKLTSEPVERYRDFKGAALRRKCVRWVHDQASLIPNRKPVIPTGLDDRQADMWELLLVLAELASDAWAEKARAAALRIGNRSETASLSEMLLTDIHTAFTSKAADRLKTDDILAVLNDQTNRPWSTICHGREMTAQKLSSLLSGFKIRPGSIRLSQGTAKGYLRNQFEDAWRRYVPACLQERSQSRALVNEAVDGRPSGTRAQTR